jgi:hypothetical protein
MASPGTPSDKHSSQAKRSSAIYARVFATANT